MFDHVLGWINYPLHDQHDHTRRPSGVVVATILSISVTHCTLLNTICQNSTSLWERTRHKASRAILFELPDYWLCCSRAAARQPGPKSDLEFLTCIIFARRRAVSKKKLGAGRGGWDCSSNSNNNSNRGTTQRLTKLLENHLYIHRIKQNPMTRGSEGVEE